MVAVSTTLDRMDCTVDVVHARLRRIVWGHDDREAKLQMQEAENFTIQAFSPGPLTSKDCFLRSFNCALLVLKHNRTGDGQGLGE